MLFCFLIRFKRFRPDSVFISATLEAVLSLSFITMTTIPNVNHGLIIRSPAIIRFNSSMERTFSGL